jgi:hypothetical protein
MGHLVGGLDYANLPRGFHRNERRNNKRIKDGGNQGFLDKTGGETRSYGQPIFGW